MTMAITATTHQLHTRLPRRLIVAIASGAAALVALAILTPRPDTASLAPGDVIDKFISARQMGDIDTATKLFQSDASFTDSAGNTSRGMDAAARLIERYNGFEAGARQVTGNEVVWTEALPIRAPDGLHFQQELMPELAGEVPYYASIQAMCAVVTNGTIHAVFALPAAETFVTGRHCARDEGRNSNSTALVVRSDELENMRDIPDSVIHADQPVYTRSQP